MWNEVREENGLKKPENPKDLRRMDQRLASFEQDARQPHLAMEADVPAEEKTRERTEGAAKAVQAMHGDRFSANRVQAGPKITSTSFSVKAEPFALPCRDDVLVENGAAAPKSCLSPLKMRTPTAAGGLLHTGKTSSATRTTFDQPPLRFYSTEETNSEKTSTQSASYDSSCWRNFQVNTGVLYFLDYVEDIYIMVLSVLVSTLNLNHMYLPLLL